jgi:hypothetical protein
MQVYNISSKGQKSLWDPKVGFLLLATHIYIDIDILTIDIKFDYILSRDILSIDIAIDDYFNFINILKYCLLY